MSPQADYVVSNGTGAAVRSDINGQLAAIVSNNSGASAPATTYAYMPWADTSTNLLKLRNGANSAWITVGDLTAANLGLATLASPTFTGTATIPTLTVSTAANIPLGSAASPTLYFTGDSNTGLYSPGADQVAISTGGSGRLFINSSGYTSIGNSSPQALVHFGAGTSAPAFGTASNLLYGCTAGQTEVQLRTTVNDVTGSIYTDSNGVNVRAASAHPLSFHTSNTERLRITSAGLVGIGTTSPGRLLQVSSTSSDPFISIIGGATNNGGLLFGDNVSDAVGQIRYDHVVDAMLFNTNGSERARLDSSGRWLLGTSTDATARLVVKGSAGSGDDGINVISGSTTVGSKAAIFFTPSTSGSFSTGSAIKAERLSPDGTDLQFYTCTALGNAPTERMRIRSNGIVSINRDGNASPTSDPQQLFIGEGGTNNFAIMVMQTGGNSGASRDYIRFYNYLNQLTGSIQHNGATSVSYNTSSDYRLKENITPVSDGIERLLQLKPSRFKFIAEPEKTVDGFIAHEVQQIVPEAINGEKDGIDSDGNPVYQGIDQSKLVPLLTAALQEAIAKIETLEARLTALESA